MVRKIKKITGESSRHIFLYECTVSDKCTNTQYAVCNMLTEDQNAIAIYNWIANWLRDGAQIPNEVVTDMSLALMYACVLAFSKFKSLNDYINHCFDAIFLKNTFVEKCYLRYDVAHIMKVISGWTSLKSQHRLTKQFYLKAMGQLIQCTVLTDMENILKSLFTVAYSCYVFGI